MLNSRKEVEPYVPHSGDMVLINRVVEHSPEHIVTEVDIGSHFPCYADGRVPAYVCIELMAQSIGVWAGICRDDPDSRPPIGFLLGTRRFHSTQEFFQEGVLLKISAHQVIQNNGLATFACEIEQVDGADVAMKIATADVNVYSEPENSSLSE